MESKCLRAEVLVQGLGCNLGPWVRGFQVSGGFGG